MRYLWLILILLVGSSVDAQVRTRPFAVGEIDTTTPYIGQPIIYTLRVFSLDPFPESIVTEPNFFDFGRSRIQLQPTAITETFEGLEYNVIEQRYVIYPLRAGDLTVDPFQIDIPETPFDPSWTIFTDPVTLTVLPYPEPIPDSFTNGVGQFDIEATASPTTLQSGDALTFSITVSGTGNIEQLLAPRLTLPDSWRVFDDETDFTQDNLRFGSKVFTWTIIVSGAGAATIPPIRFSYFNPQIEGYEERITSPIPLQIVASTAAPEVTIDRPDPTSTLTSLPELLPLDAAPQIPSLPPTWFWWLWAIPPIISAMILLISRSTRPEIPSSTPQRRTRPKRSRNRALHALKQAFKGMPADKLNVTYEMIAEAIYAYLEAKTGLSVSDETAKDALSKLPAQYQAALQQCLDDATGGQYAPVTLNDARQLMRRILRVAEAIEKDNV